MSRTVYRSQVSNVHAGDDDFDDVQSTYIPSSSSLFFAISATAATAALFANSFPIGKTRPD